MEMIGAIVTQLTRNLSVEEIKKSGFDAYFTDHTAGVYPVSAAGVPFDVKYIGVKGDAIADLNEDLAADAAQAHEQPFRRRGNCNIGPYFPGELFALDKFPGPVLS